MKLNTFVSSIADIEQCVVCPQVGEVLIEPDLLARQGQLSYQDALSLADLARERGLRPVLVWDILMPEQVRAEICTQLSAWDLERFAAIRVCDIGAAWWIKTHQPNLPIQLMVETGNHNLSALAGWCDLFAPQLERLSLSIELPEEKLIQICQELPVPCELLAVGQILLFYSPRSLLATPFSATEEEDQFVDEAPFIQAFATADQASVKHFPTLETKHGTFMFLDKDQFILDRFEALAEAGLHTLRLDLRHISKEGQSASPLIDIVQAMQTDPTTLRKSWPRKTRAPFFKANKTTAQFSRMKSPLHMLRDDSCLAEVVAGKKKKYVVLQTLRAFSTDEIEQLVLPTGEIVPITDPRSYRNLSGDTVEIMDEGQLMLTDWIKGACSGALLQGIHAES
ncbi:MAG: U32 family peptidase [Chloroflexota bacterium]